ncbi:MAG: amidohydrolase, partial [Clostridia bacterium]
MENYKIVGDEIDLKGKFLTPGFIDAHCHIGIFEDSIGFEGDDGNEDTDPITPQLRAIDAINPFDKCFDEALTAGITTVVSGPGSANPIAGQIVALKTYGKTIEEMIVKQPLAIKIAFGENPKTVYHGKSLSPVTRMATASLIREQLFKTKRYNEDIEKADADKDYDLPDFCAKNEAMLNVINNNIPVHAHAHRADDILTAIRIAKEFNIKLVIIHGTDSQLVTDELKNNGIPVLFGPALCDRCKPELK